MKTTQLQEIIRRYPGYTVCEKIAETHATTVVRATHSNHPDIAVKIHTADNPKQHVWQYLDDVLHFGRLQHPNIAQVVERNPLAGYEVQFLAQGKSVYDHVLPKECIPLPFDHKTMLLLGMQVLQAIKHISEQGYVLGNLHPSDVVVQGTTATLVDLGLLFPKDQYHGGLTPPIQLHAFAAPEQLYGALDEETPLFGVGALMFFAATGTSPYQSVNGESYYGRCLERAALHDVNPSIPWETSQFVRKLLSFQPEGRGTIEQAELGITMLLSRSESGRQAVLEHYR